MTRYILDTHVLVWFLKHDKKLPENIREDIEYFQHEYYVSFLSLIEIDNLKKLRKIDLEYSFLELIKQLQNSCIGILFGNTENLAALFNLDIKNINGKFHADYIDRAIIATAIANKHTCISADTKFPYYRNNGLKLVEV
jgi:PIN domain nuclease of toxin-antitoxin system